MAGHLAHVIHNSRLHDAALTGARRVGAAFRGLIESSIQGILVHRQLQPLFVNEAYARLFGYTVAEILSLETITHLLAADDRERIIGASSSLPDKFRCRRITSRVECAGTVRRSGLRNSCR